MKVRTGFVSNSSSQSFVIAKCYMTEGQIQQFGDWLSKMYDDPEPLYETNIGETDLYFIGEKSQHESRITEFLTKIGVDPKYICEYQ
jgi:hypothetical protein